MKVIKTSNEQSAVDRSLQKNNNSSYARKYQLPFSYLGDTQFKGQYLWLSNITVEPEVDYLSVIFYQQQTNFNYKSPINQKQHQVYIRGKSVIKKIIELNQKQVKSVRLPKMEADKMIAIQIKTSEGTMVARFPLQVQTTKTPLYNNRSQLVGFLSYKLTEANFQPQNGLAYFDANLEEADEELENEQQSKAEDQYLKQVIKQDQEVQKTHIKKQKQSQSKKLQNQIIAYLQQEKAKMSATSSNQFLPKQKIQVGFSQRAQMKKNTQKPKSQEKINDQQENSKLDKHPLPRMVLSPSKIEQIKSQSPSQPSATKENFQTKRELKQARGQKSLMVRIRQMQHKAMTEKQKMQQKERLKQNNRFKINKHLSPEEKKSQKSKESQEQNENQLPGTPKVYKIPIQLMLLKDQNHKGQPQSADNKKLSLDIPVEIGGRTYLQKYFKQFTPKNGQKMITKNHSKDQSIIAGAQGKNLVRKPGFITSHKKANDIRQHIRDYTITRKRPQVTKKQKEVGLIIMSKSQSQENSIPPLLKNQRLKLKVSKNIVNILVNQKPKKISLTKVIDESYFPLLHQEKQLAEKKILKPTKDPLPKRQLEAIAQQKSPTKNTSLKISDKTSFQSQLSTPTEQQYSFDIIVSNLSVNLYNKAFGKKFIELTQNSQMFTTDSLHGSHLLWVNRGYLFKGLQSANFIQVSLKCQMDKHLRILGKTNIKVDELLLNYKQSFYQTYLYSPSPLNELLAVVIIGYEIFNHLKISPRLQSDNLPITLAKKQKKKVNIAEFQIQNRLPSLVTEDNSRTSMQKSKYRKYQGGQKIRIGKGNRFNTEYIDDEPVSEYYNIISEFNGHTVSRRQK